MQFDDFYETIGAFGRFQKVKYLLVCLTYILPPIMVYSWTFTAATPSFRCQITLPDDSETTIPGERLQRYVPSEAQCSEQHKRLAIAECQRCYRVASVSHPEEDALTPCTDFVFDRTHYQSTLVEEWSMVCNRVSWKSFSQTIFFLGYIVGSIVFGVLSDNYGRRPVMGVSFVIIAVASFICAFAPQRNLGFEISYGLFVFGRFLIGCATRGIALTGFVIGVELVGLKQRLFTGVVIQYFFAIGDLILLLFAYLFRTWRLLHITLAVLSIPFMFFYFFLPESPRWLIAKGYYDRAEVLLRKIAKTNNRTFDAAAYQRLVSEEKKRAAIAAEKKSGLMVLFRSKVMFVITVNLSLQWFVQNLVFYGVSQNTGVWLSNPYIAFGASALVEIAAYLVVHPLLHHWGRKSTYCVFVAGFAVFALLVVPVQMLMIKDSPGQYGLMFTINVILKFFASGSYGVIYIYANELFPTQVRNTGIGLCSMIARIGTIAGTLSNDFLARVWLHFPIVIYGATSILAVIFVTICPETLNKSLPQTVDDVEIMGVALPWSRPRRVTRIHIDDENIDEQMALKIPTKETAAV